MAKTALKGILTIAIVIVLAVAGMAIWNHFTSGSAVGTATTAITGSTKLGDLVGKLSFAKCDNGDEHFLELISP